MAAGDFTTVAAVEAYSGITSSTTTDALIQSLITSASAFMKQYMNRNILSASYTETYNGSGNDQLCPRNIPVTAVASVTMDGLAVPQSTNPNVIGWTFDNGTIYYRFGSFTKGVQNVTVVYTAGYATVPADLAQCCIDLVTVKYQRRTKMLVQGETLAQQTITFLRTDLTAGAQLVLDQWRDMRPIW